MTDPAEITIPDREMTFEEFLAWAETVPKEAGRTRLRASASIHRDWMWI